MSITNIRSIVCALGACMALCTACLFVSCGSSDASSDQTAEESQNAAETGGAAADDTSSEPSEAVDAPSDESGEPAQATLTLEEYFNQNPSVYEQMLESFEQGFANGSSESVPMTATLEAHDNAMVCRVVVDSSFDDDMVSAAQEAMDSEMDGYEGSMTALVSQMEESTGCSPITITLGYYDRDGKAILERTYE